MQLAERSTGRVLILIDYYIASGHGEVNTMFIWGKSDFSIFFHGVIIMNVHVIIYHWKGQPFFYLKQIFFLFLFNVGKKFWFFSSQDIKNKSDFPCLIIQGKHLCRCQAFYGLKSVLRKWSFVAFTQKVPPFFKFWVETHENTSLIL